MRSASSACDRARTSALAVLSLVLSTAAAPAVAAGPLEDAHSAYNGGDYATALWLIRPLADEGNAEAQFVLGDMYDLGQGVPQNYPEAVKWCIA